MSTGSNTMSDIAELLRSQKWSSGVTINRYADEAAQEIEHLREKLAEVQRYARTLEATIAELERKKAENPAALSAEQPREFYAEDEAQAEAAAQEAMRPFRGDCEDEAEKPRDERESN